MRVMLDIETDGLDNPSNIWTIVCKDIDTNDVHVFSLQDVYSRFPVFAASVTQVIGHNIIYFDLVWLARLVGVRFLPDQVVDTLVLSQLLRGSRTAHSLDSWGEDLGFPKQPKPDFSRFSEEMVGYCKNDVELNHRVYQELKEQLDRDERAYAWAVRIEHEMRFICRDMHENGFGFNIQNARKLDEELSCRLEELDRTLETSFPPVVRRVQLKTKAKEIVEVFNPASPKQIVDRLWEAGWTPVEKTDTHIELAKKKKRTPDEEKRLERFKRYGWKINEVNLGTLPADAPLGCRNLVERLLVSARRRTLAEWFDSYNPATGRIHGSFNPLGTRTQRCTHTSPNMGNIATKKTIKYNSPNLRDLAVRLGGEMRSLWCAEDGKWLVGCDMESAHLRIFAHLINDKDFVNALISGRKEDGTDPHSVNQRVLGPICVDRDRAKTFIFSFLNGAGASKISQVFNCSFPLAEDALRRFVRSYPGLEELKRKKIPEDAKHGYFVGVDRRPVLCSSEHHMIGMYLQNTESILMKYANRLWRIRLEEEGCGHLVKQVNWVHDEWVSEVEGDRSLAERVGAIQAMAIKETGERFKLKCPMGGEYKVGKNWLEVH